MWVLIVVIFSNELPVDIEMQEFSSKTRCEFVRRDLKTKIEGVKAECVKK